MKIPFVDLHAQYLTIKKDIDVAIATVIKESAYIGGTYVKEFEARFAELYGVKHVISCANGTDSLYILMKMLGIGTGDEVITVANSWISSSETITQTGAKPVFVDIHPVYYSMDESLLEESITPKTKAVIAVHLQGQMCEIDTIQEICHRHGIALIEDCAQSHFSEYKGIRAGLRGVAGSFSFYPGKNLGAYGDAGCIITNDDVIAEKCRMYATHGALKKHEHQMEGINSRLDGMQAAILLAKLPYILEWTEKRKQVAQWYKAYLAGNKKIQLPVIRENSEHTFHLFVILVEERASLVEHLKSKCIDTAVHYPVPLPLMKAYQYLGYSDCSFPATVSIRERILSLPIYPEMTEDMVKYVADSINEFY